jgi:hypothetical protein
VVVDDVDEIGRYGLVVHVFFLTAESWVLKGGDDYDDADRFDFRAQFDGRLHGVQARRPASTLETE